MTVQSTAVQPSRRSPAHASGVRRGRVVSLSLLAGLAISILWSAKLVDTEIGVNTANGILGPHATTSAIGSSLAGVAFAFVTGLAGTFTACNVAVFSAIAPMLEGSPSLGKRVSLALRPLGWLALGAVTVAAVYGVVGVELGSSLPQLSTTKVDGHAIRVYQSIGVYSVLGLAMVYLGLAELSLVPDPLRRISARLPQARSLLMGAMIGGFLIGRPWPMFFKMFTYAVSTNNPLYGALSLVLVALGNILLMAALFLLLALSPFPQWLRARDGRVARFAAAALLVGGFFTVFYWGVRAPSHLGIGWFPTMPWH